MMASTITPTGSSTTKAPPSPVQSAITSGGSGSFQRLVAIPQDEYNQLASVFRTQMNQPPAVQQLTRLQEDYFKNIPEASKDPYNKLLLQGEALDGIKRYREKIADDLSLGTPKPYRNRALSLYNQIASAIAFNERGELLENSDTPQQQAILGSRVEDLIQHAVRDRRKQFTPVGWEIFLDLLKKHNIPRMTLNRATVDELQKLTTPTAATADAPSPPTTTTTTTTPPPSANITTATTMTRGRPREVKRLGASGRSKRLSAAVDKER